MATVYTRRFFAVTKGPAASWQPLWTVPEGGTWILRSLLLGNLQSSSGAALVDLLARDSSVQSLLAGGTLAATSVVGGDTRQELLPGETIRLYSPTTGNTVIATGYHFLP